MDDFLEAETAIRYRLIEQVPELVDVIGVPLMDRLASMQQELPVASVMFLRHDRVPAEPQSAMMIYTQTWVISLYCESTQEALFGGGARAAAGPLLWKILGALEGWRPTPTSGRLVGVSAPRDSEYAKGVATFFTAFQTDLTLVPTAPSDY